MALFPITGHYVGDFIPHLVAVDTDDTMDQVATKVAHHTVGRRLPFPATDQLDVTVGGERIAGDRTLGSLGLEPLDWVTVRARDGAS